MNWKKKPAFILLRSCRSDNVNPVKMAENDTRNISIVSGDDAIKAHCGT